MSRRSKKRPGKGRSRRFSHSYSDALSSIDIRLAVADTQRMSAVDATHHEIAMLSALKSIIAGFHPPSYNLVTYYFRVSQIIAGCMKMPGFAAIIERAKVSLARFYEQDSKDGMHAQMHADIRQLLDGLIALLPEIPLSLWRHAEEASTAYVHDAIVDRYMELEEWERRIAHEVIYNGADPAAAALAAGKPMPDAANAIMSVVCMAHTLTMDMLIPFPANLAEALTIRDQLKQTALLLMTTSATTQAIEARLQQAA